MFGIVLFLTAFSFVHCISLNQIQHAKLNADVSKTFFNQSQRQCICQMVNSIQSMSALNYLSTNQTCQLFSSNLTLIDVDLDVDWILIYINQSLISNIFGELTKSEKV